MPEFKHTVDGHVVKSAQIQVTDPFDKARCQKELDVIMGKLKEQGYKHCQVTTIFDTSNRKNEFRSAHWVNLEDEAIPKAELYVNNFSQDQPRERPKSVPQKRAVITSEQFRKARKHSSDNDSDDDSDSDDDRDYEDGGGGGNAGEAEYFSGVNADVVGYTIQYHK